MKILWAGFALVIFAGISGLMYPQGLVERKNRGRISRGESPISEEEMPKYIKNARLFSAFMIILGIFVIAVDIVSTYFA